jgi:ElaB/YqjD/DUF883 family membrane-anchored ribosome-binding protein
MDSKTTAETSLNRKNNKLTMSDIRLRKKKLQDDLDLLEGSFENRITRIRKNIMGAFEPVEYIKRNPFKSVGVAVIAGIALGLSGRKKGGDDEGGRSATNKLIFSTLLLDELKRLAAQRAASYVSDLIDQRMNSTKDDR